MRVFIILGFLVAASSAGDLSGYSYSTTARPLTESLQGSGSSLVGNIGLAGTGGLIGNRLISTGNSGIISSGNLIGNGLINTGNTRVISTGGYGSGLIGNRYGSGIISNGGGIIGNGGGLISTGGYGGRLIGAGGLIGSGSGLINGGGQIISGGSGLINGGSQIISGGSGLVGIGGGSQIISGGSGLVSGGVSNVIGIPSLDSIPQTVEYSKQFFHFEAPEEIQEEGTVTKQLSNVLKKNLQVVFIKAPENNAATSAALQLAKQAIEQKTDIYVLSKQNDGAQLVGQLQQIQENVPTVPDVRIVKYRTPQDLAYAKEIIQAQYENTGGSSESYDGGVAPVLNYASGVSTLSSGGALLGSGLGSTNIIGGGAVLGSGLGSTNIIGGGSVLGSGLGPTTTIIDNGPLISSGLGSTKIIGSSPVSIGSTRIIGSTPVVGSIRSTVAPLTIGSTISPLTYGSTISPLTIGSTISPIYRSGISSTKIVNGGSILNSGNYGLGSNNVVSYSSPETTQILPPLKKK
ncbi:ice nucleation protein-like isoform X2 [Eupeodes corollae]|uniref:ice nucleation protein-like isoform X2 n=1 Tax=Eupeodes corollae TaxID=290404 RepID=UPI0024906A98|nr:ice nucleation protein-like isoform X2 [Eupeodes corollae]